MDRELLMRDMISGYRSYAQPADLDLGATTEAPALSWKCINWTYYAATSISAISVGIDYALGRDSRQAPSGPPPR